MTQSKSNGIQEERRQPYITLCGQGRNDLEDGALGTRVHHITRASAK